MSVRHYLSWAGIGRCLKSAKSRPCSSPAKSIRLNSLMKNWSQMGGLPPGRDVINIRTSAESRPDSLVHRGCAMSSLRLSWLKRLCKGVGFQVGRGQCPTGGFSSQRS